MLTSTSFKKGHPVSLETRERISKSNKGKKRTKETRKKLSEAHKGIRPWARGKHWKMSEEGRKKNSEAHKGKKSYLWRGGITPINAKIRNGIEFRLWREAVFARDNWTCQKCKERGLYLHSHHILNFATYLELRFAIDNGITLCKKCHREFHKIYGKKKNTKEQMATYLAENLGK